MKAGPASWISQCRPWHMTIRTHAHDCRVKVDCMHRVWLITECSVAPEARGLTFKEPQAVPSQQRCPQIRRQSPGLADISQGAGGLRCCKYVACCLHQAAILCLQ